MQAGCDVEHSNSSCSSSKISSPKVVAGNRRNKKMIAFLKIFDSYFENKPWGTLTDRGPTIERFWFRKKNWKFQRESESFLKKKLSRASLTLQRHKKKINFTNTSQKLLNISLKGWKCLLLDPVGLLSPFLKNKFFLLVLSLKMVSLTSNQSFVIRNKNTYCWLYDETSFILDSKFFTVPTVLITQKLLKIKVK